LEVDAMKAPNVRLVGKHMKGCHSLRYFRDGTWRTPWGVSERKWLNIWGTSKGNYIWLEWGCNITECPAKLKVRTDYLLELVNVQGDESK
jgi:hypothetical protein